MKYNGGESIVANILLVYPPEIHFESMTYPAFKCQSLGLYILTSCLRAADHQVTIMDSQVDSFTIDGVIKQIQQVKFNLIGVSFTSQLNYQDARILVKRIRQGGYDNHITVGGHFATFEAKNILLDNPGIDSVLCGEAEDSIIELANCIDSGESLIGIKGLTLNNNGNIIENESRTSIINLNSIPFPARDVITKLVESNDYVQVAAQRGCYGNCTFCSINSFYDFHGVRRRSPKNVVEELESLQYEYGAKKITFVDDEFCDRSKESIEWVKELTSEISSRNLTFDFWIQIRANDFKEEVINPLVNVGLKRVFIGIESMSQNVLNRLKKKVKISDNTYALNLANKMGLETEIGFLMFEPYISFSDLCENYKWISLYEFSEPVHYYSYVIPYSGTPLRKQLFAEGHLIASRWYEIGFYKFIDPKVEVVFKGMQALMPQIRHIEYALDCIINHFHQKENYENISKIMDPCNTKPISTNQEIELFARKSVHNTMSTVFGKYLSVNSDNIKPLIRENITLLNSVSNDLIALKKSLEPNNGK